MAKAARAAGAVVSPARRENLESCSGGKESKEGDGIPMVVEKGLCGSHSSLYTAISHKLCHMEHKRQSAYNKQPNGNTPFCTRGKMLVYEHRHSAFLCSLFPKKYLNAGHGVALPPTGYDREFKGAVRQSERTGASLAAPRIRLFRECFGDQVAVFCQCNVSKI